MAVREFMRPWPLVLIFLFAAVAVTDFVHHLREEKPPPPDLLADGAVRFTEREPVFDLRANTDFEDVAVVPAFERVGPWSGPGSGGTWVMGDGAALEFFLDHGGHRMLVVFCQAAQTQGSPRFFELSVNGRAGGKVNLDSGPGPYSVLLNEGVVQAGTNTLAFHFQDSAAGAKARPLLLVRQVGLVLDEDDSERMISNRAAIDVDTDRDQVVINTPGSLQIPFVLDDRTDALQMRYKFSGGVGRAEVQVARPEGGGEGLDAVVRRTVSAEQHPSGRIRVPLHGRRGEFVLRIDVELGPRPERLKLTSLTLVKEGDPTRRQR